MEFISEAIFKHPYTCMMAGPSKSGKTTLLYKILQKREKVFDKPPDRIVYCYTRWKYQLLSDKDMFDSKVNNLLILDVLMNECGDDKQIYVFTIDSHHKNISVFFLAQN